jgi:rubredoxin
MKCPKCKNSKTYVTQSLTETGQSRVLRKRVCPVCQYRFQTSELMEGNIVEATTPFPVDDLPPETSSRKSKPKSRVKPQED